MQQQHIITTNKQQIESIIHGTERIKQHKT